MIKKKKHGGPSGKGGRRDAPFQAGGAPVYPSPTAVSSPYRTRPFDTGRNNRLTHSPSFDEFDEDNIEEAYAHAANVEMKRREMGWSTSFPAEYHNTHQSNDYKQTLAFQEQLNLRKRSEQQIADAVLTANGPTGVLPKRGPGNVSNSSPNKQYLELIKQVNMREGILSKLRTLANTAAASGNGFDADSGTELLQLLLQLRDASVSVVSAMAKWHQTTPQHGDSRMQAFVFQNQNYCVKMVSDLNFLAHFSSLSRVLGVDAVRMKQNPFMMPSPIPDRDFHDVQAAAPPRFAFTDPVQRVGEAEKYLVWSLVNLSDSSTVQHDAAISGVSQSAQSQSAVPPPPLNGFSAQPPPGSSQAKRELLTWQQRAENQLRMLSMPLELAPGHAHVMDSSRMMKRKGYLPALPLSPPKTLTQLMDNVHKGGYSSPTKSSGFASFEVQHDGIPYRMTAFDIEVLGTNEAPPHTIVTLVSASVLILLSPSDRIPKDLGWTSCQKMLANGLRLIQRIEGVDIDGIPAFKWKALLPFLQNEHFDPMFLMEYSGAAATLCAWVLHVLDRAQYNDSVTMKNDTDRRELLQELEREDEDEQQQQLQQLPPCKPPSTPTSALRPSSRASTPHGSKRVTIGNAEVLFINENEPVSPPSTASRPVSSASTSGVSSSIVAQPRRHVLLRTSPWTHRGVTYFVSFFLEKSDEDEMLSIKMYEPMSSVESQMFVSPDDLALDFGDRAADYFQRRDFGLLCELILNQLDGMIAGGSSPPSRDERRSSGSNAVLQLTGRKGYPQQDERDDQDEDAEAAAVRIQCLARRQHAKKRVDGLRAQRKDEATTRIQCAVRQRHARNKVQRVRFAKQQHREIQEQSAVKIQSIARKRQAQQLVSHMRLLERTPTGLPTASFDDEAEEPETSELANDGNHDGNDNGLVLSAETLERHEQQTHHVGAHTSQTQSDARPQTSMSYASEQFEEDFEAEE